MRNSEDGILWNWKRPRIGAAQRGVRPVPLLRAAQLDRARAICAENQGRKNVRPSRERREGGREGGKKDGEWEAIWKLRLRRRRSIRSPHFPLSSITHVVGRGEGGRSENETADADADSIFQLL